MLPKDKTFTFGPFTFSRIHGLRQGNRPIPLRHVERQLLKCLLDRPNEIVRKEEIVATLWPTSHVSPNTLNVHVRRLRITLKDTTRPHQLLKAFPRMGFMLVAQSRTYTHRILSHASTRGWRQVAFHSRRDRPGWIDSRAG